MFMKEIEQGEKKKFSHAYGLEKSYYPKWSTGPMQSLSKYQWILHWIEYDLDVDDEFFIF
jgi:hypothetical protein